KTKNNKEKYPNLYKSRFKWIEFIKRLKKTGMPLKQIKKYSILRYKGDSTIQARLSLLYDQKQRLEKNNKEIEAHIVFLEQKINIYKSKLATVNNR
ncbi:MerR family DNA-binding protein, partial [Bombilactobacillus bombi]|uniref:MerR family DNA-binding protein n=1 Tax=Bombilactobacillus bombi TaxID=1303590 RepID=UPI0015E5A185